MQKQYIIASDVTDGRKRGEMLPLAKCEIRIAT